MDYILAIDQGTTSSRAIIFDSNGQENGNIFVSNQSRVKASPALTRTLDSLEKINC